VGGVGSQAIFFVRDMDVVVTHKVDFDSWRGEWEEVFALVKRILEARVLVMPG
jgi:hypothetical protein